MKLTEVSSKLQKCLAAMHMLSGYQDIPSLITALASNWNEGKKQLYRGLMSAFFKNFNPEIAGFCMDAEEEATRTAGKDDIIFWNLLYKIYPELNGFYWMGQIYESLPALGRDMLERLWKNDKAILLRAVLLARIDNQCFGSVRHRPNRCGNRSIVMMNMSE